MIRATEQLALPGLEPRDLARRLGNVADMPEQLLVLAPERLCRAHLSRSSLSSIATSSTSAHSAR
jgi:hypothetical protein